MGIAELEQAHSDAAAARLAAHDEAKALEAEAATLREKRIKQNARIVSAERELSRVWGELAKARRIEAGEPEPVAQESIVGRK